MTEYISKIQDENTGKIAYFKDAEARNQLKNTVKKTVIENGKLYLLKDDGTKIDTGTTLPVVENGSVDLSNYVEKIDGKGLSTNDFTDVYKTKLDNLSNNDGSGSSVSIDDSTTSIDKTWSSDKINSQLNNIANEFTTEQTDNLYKIKYGEKVIAEIPIGNTTSSLETFGNLLSSITTWNVMGNSITDETINPTTKYPTILKNKYTNITTVNNYAHNGWHVAVKSDTGYNSFLTLIDSMSSSCDLITIAGGVNDFIQSVPIGERSSTLDTEFYGAVNNLITRLRIKYPDVTIVWIIPIPMKNGVFGTNSDGTNQIGNTLEDYRKALRNKLNDLQVKVIDLSTDADMDYNKISNDGLHPTANGHQTFANKLDNSTPFIPLGEQVIPCTNITLNQSTLTFTTTDSQTLIATKTPSNTTNSVVWSVNPTDIVTINNGVVTPIKTGNCTITATCGEKTATCSVTVNIDTSTDDSEKMKVTMNGYKFDGFDLTALINNPKTAISTIKFKLKAHDFTNCYVVESPYAVATWLDTTGEVNNGEGVNKNIYARYSKDEDYYVYSWSINDTYTEDYLKVVMFIKPSDTSIECSMIIDDIQILIDDVKVPILKLGGFFNNAEVLTGDIDYILNYLHNLN